MDLLERREFVAWHGLPRCSLPELIERFPLHVDGLGHGRLGERARDFVLVRAKAYDQPLRAWVDDSGQVLAIDVEYPQISGLPAQLGEPAARRDLHWAGLALQGGELVFPTRGLALFVNPENHDLLRLEVFPSGSLDDYDKFRRLHLRPRRRMLS
jgi:hypothetical protein